ERVAVATARHNPQLQRIADSAMRAMRPRLFEGKDDVMASAELASYVGDVARRARVWLQDAGTRPATPAAEGVRTLRVEIRAESDLQGTLLFLQGLERGDKLVRIDRLDISHAARSDEKDAEVLSITATISGFAVSDSMTTASIARPTVASVGPIVEAPR
ncbi:MAG TPA: GspMb/PilO family protein, partial [Gemmatimonadaceae bacterium]|nr:GspMb/PilO family protein [Gemmatimonadaceae bacterium]